MKITTRGGVAIGRDCVVNGDVNLDGRGGLVVGDLVNSPEVACLTADHDIDFPESEGRVRPGSVGSRRWVTTWAIVTPGATVGGGCVVGAGAVVTGETPAWSVMAGVPARKLCSRPSTAQPRLLPYRRWFR